MEQVGSSHSILKVAIDARKLDSTGIGNYLRNHITGLGHRSDVEVILFGNPILIKKESFADQVRIIPNFDDPHSIMNLFSFSSGSSLKRYDVLHIPHYIAPLSSPIPMVVTVHDCIHIEHPEKWYYPIISKHILRAVSKASNHIISVSDRTKSSIIKVCGPEVEKKIRVIAPGFSMSQVENSKASSSHDPYILFILSTFKPHKGYKILFEAWEAIAATTQNLPVLTIAGFGAQKIKSLPPHSKNIGAVSRDNLVRLYRDALFCVIPSELEGFGYPVLESHAAGTPVVVRPVEPLTAHCTDADSIAHDFSKEALIDALHDGLNRYRERSQPINFFEHEKAYSVAEQAEKVVSVYKEAVQ